MDKETLKKKTVAELKEEAKKIPDAKGLSSMKKDDLIDLLLEHTGAGSPAKKPAKTSKKSAPAKGKGPLDKGQIKQLIRDLKKEKQDALSQQDRAKAKHCNRQIHDYKRRLRKMAGKKKPK